MKKYLYLLLFTSLTISSQTRKENDSNVSEIEMLFPDGKTKALILSYDDGTIFDRKLVALMNQYHLIGTFHLNSNKLGTDVNFNYLNKEEIKELLQVMKFRFIRPIIPIYPIYQKQMLLMRLWKIEKSLSV